MYWLEIAMPNNELLVWEYLKARQVIFPNNYINLGCKVRTGKYDKKVDTL